MWWEGERMGAGVLPSFHNTYLQVLEQMEKLKRIHDLQVRNTEVAPRLSMEAAGNKSGCWNGAENPEVGRLFSISQVVVDLGRSNERESDGDDGTNFGVHEREMFSRENRIQGKGVQGGGSQVLEKQTKTSCNEMRERRTTREVESEGQKEGFQNFLMKKHQQDEKETMEDEEQRSWKIEEVWNQDDGKKRQRKEEFTFHVLERDVVELGEVIVKSDVASIDEEKNHSEARIGKKREENDDDPLIDVSNTTLHPNSDGETASETDKSHRHLSRLELSSETLKREVWHEIYEELTRVLSGYIPFEKNEGSDSLLSFVNWIGHFVRDRLDLLQREASHIDDLKDALTRQLRENEGLRSQKAALQDQLNVILSSLQQGSM